MKKIGKIFFVIGVFAVFFSIYLFRTNEQTTDNYIKVAFSQITGDNVDNSNYPSYENKLNKKYSVKSNNIEIKNVYHFSFPEEFSMAYSYEYGSTLVAVKSGVLSTEMFEGKIDDCITELVESYRNLDSAKVKYSLGKDKYHDTDIIYYKIQSLNTENSNDNISYIEEFILFIKEKENNYFKLSLKLFNKKMTDEYLSKIVNQVKIDKGSANYLYSTIKNGEIFVSLNTEKNFAETSNATLNLELNAEKYKEIEDYRNSISSDTFELIDGGTVNLEFVSNSSSNYKEEYIQNVRDSLSLAEQKVVYDDIKVYDKYEFNVFQFDVSTSTKTYHNVYMICNVKDDLYYKLSFENFYNFDDSIVADFLNFDIYSK